MLQSQCPYMESPTQKSWISDHLNSVPITYGTHIQ